MPILRISTRGSQLALWQANWVREKIQTAFPDVNVELVVIKTQGDRIQDRPLAAIGGKGLFVKELEVALLEGTADLAVHSMKDVPSQLPQGLEISIITQRAAPGDALITPNYSGLDALPRGAVVGTSSLRRMSQLKAYRSDLEVRPLRGNVDTRIQKVQRGDVDAAVMAVAGLQRLEMQAHIQQILPFSIMLPAVAQGAIGIETRVGDEDTVRYLRHLQDDDTRDCLLAERRVLINLEGNCQIPLAGYATLRDNQVTLTALLAHPDGSQIIRHSATASRDQAELLGNQVAQYLLEAGGKQILESCGFGER